MKIKNVKLKQLKNKPEEKLLKKLQEEEKHVDNEELIAELIAAHKRRRSEIIQTVKTLDQLTKALKREGSNLKRSSCISLVPKNGRTRERKQNVITAPVKLILAKNSKHQSYLCTKFARDTINALEELAGILGPADVTFHFRDDTAKLPIALTIVSKETPFLMHMD